MEKGDDHVCMTMCICEFRDRERERERERERGKREGRGERDEFPPVSYFRFGIRQTELNSVSDHVACLLPE